MREKRFWVDTNKDIAMCLCYIELHNSTPLQMYIISEAQIQGQYIQTVTIVRLDLHLIIIDKMSSWHLILSWCRKHLHSGRRMYRH